MQPPRRDQWTPLAGVFAAITFIAGVLLSSAGPDSSDSDAKVLAWYADHGHRIVNIGGAYLLAFCGLFFVWFAADLRQRLRAAEGPGGGRLSSVALGGAILFVGLLWVGAAALVAVSGGKSFGSEPLTNADIARFLPQVGFPALLVFAMFGAIAFIDATSIVIVRTGILPRWFAWLGFVCTVVLLFGAVFFPIIALPIWLLAGSIVLFRHPTLEAEPDAAVPKPPG